MNRPPHKIEKAFGDVKAAFHLLERDCSGNLHQVHPDRILRDLTALHSKLAALRLEANRELAARKRANP